MKKFILFLSVVSIFLMPIMTGCGNKADTPAVSEEATPPVAVVKQSKGVSYPELSLLIGSDNAMTVFELKGLTEPHPSQKGARQVKANATVVAWLEDLSLVGSPSALTYSTSPNAYISGVTKFGPEPITNDNAVGIWSCGRRWDNVTPDPNVTCNDPSPSPGESNYRAYSADKVTYDVHVSPLLKIVN